MGFRDNILPMLVPPSNYSDMKAVLTGTQAYKIDNFADLSAMRDWLIEKHWLIVPSLYYSLYLCHYYHIIKAFPRRGAFIATYCVFPMLVEVLLISL